MATATVTLSTTTLTFAVNADDRQIKVASTSGLTPGVRLYLDRELAEVVSLGVDSWVNVRRGVDGTGSSRHASGATITIGRADQFYASDPVGLPANEVPVSPYINVLTGVHWLPQGDEIGSGRDGRWWQARTTTYSTGSLGVRTTETTPAS